MRRAVGALLVLLALLTIGSCGGERPNIDVQHSPPELAFTNAPPRYVRDPNVTLNVTATDMSGVRAVYALCGSQTWPAAKQQDGSWRVTFPLPAIGRNTVTVWGEDDVVGTPHSGFGGVPPYQVTQDIFYDPTPPSVTYDASVAFYSDERSLQVGIDGNGVAVAPPTYSFGPRVTVPVGGDFYKAWSRLSAGPSIDVGELETGNTRNIPVLRFVVPFNPNTDSPIVTAKYTAHVTCPSPCPTFPDVKGDLLPSAVKDDQRALFDLPLATETLPPLALVQGPAALSITLFAADAAGNSTTATDFNFVFHVIGPPLAIVEDAQYAAAAKPDSVYAYHLANNSYAVLWQPGAQFPTNSVRLVRYFITNPIPEPVALQLAYAQDPRGSWQAIESWKRFNVSEPTGRNADGSIYLNRPDTSVAFTMDGFAYHNAMYWSVPYGTTGWLGQAENGAHPCGSPSAGHPVHRMGDAVHKYTCDATTGIDFLSTTPEIATFSSGDVSVKPYRVALELQGQERDPDMDTSGSWILVPPASGSVPGTLVVYLARPVTAPRSRVLQWNVLAAPPVSIDAVNHYQMWDYEWWWSYNQPSSILYPGYDTYVGYRMGAYLASAQDNLYGTLSGTTQAYSGSSLLGESAQRLSVTLSREPLTTH